MNRRAKRASGDFIRSRLTIFRPERAMKRRGLPAPPATQPKVRCHQPERRGCPESSSSAVSLFAVGTGIGSGAGAFVLGRRGFGATLAGRLGRQALPDPRSPQALPPLARAPRRSPRPPLRLSCRGGASAAAPLAPRSRRSAALRRAGARPSGSCRAQAASLSCFDRRSSAAAAPPTALVGSGLLRRRRGFGLSFGGHGFLMAPERLRPRRLLGGVHDRRDGGDGGDGPGAHPRFGASCPVAVALPSSSSSSSSASSSTSGSSRLFHDGQFSAAARRSAVDRSFRRSFARLRSSRRWRFRSTPHSGARCPQALPAFC